MDKKSENLVFSVLMIVLGVLFIVYKNGVIGIAMTVFGVALIVSAILDLMHKDIVPCVVKAVIGVVVIIFGWTLVSAAIYIMAALLLIYGILRLYLAIKNRTLLDTKSKIINYVDCALYIIIGICLLFNQGGTIDWIFILSGVFLIINGVLALIQSFIPNSSSKNN